MFSANFYKNLPLEDPVGLLPFEKERREVVYKREEETNPSWGKRPEERSVEELLEFGVINLDKPRGPTSHQVAAWVKEILKVRKVGHGGTLDPKVTGVLPIGINAGTKILSTLLLAGKEYVMLMHLHGDVPEDKLREVIMSFVGEIIQVPPLKSSVKRRPRKKKIYYIEILEIDGRDVLMRVGSQAGVYMRKLAVDIGKKLGVGAHMQELRRTKSGPFREEDSVYLQDVLDAYVFWKEEGNEKYIRKVILPLEKGVEHLKKIWISDSAVDSICHGASLKVPGVVKLHNNIKKGDLIAIMTLKDELVALGISFMDSEEILEKSRGVVAKIKRVIMPTGIYPPLWRKKNL